MPHTPPVTGQEVEDYVFSLVGQSDFASLLSGGVYKEGMRPRDSRLEDAVVKFVAGLPDQIQRGTVVVLVYVSDVSPFQNGVFVRHTPRCKAIETAASKWVSQLTAAKSDYRFRLAQTIATHPEPENKQHFVSIRLNYELFTF